MSDEKPMGQVIQIDEAGIRDQSPRDGSCAVLDCGLGLHGGEAKAICASLQA